MSKEGRPPSQALGDAKAAGSLTYQGRPCRFGHTERYTSGRMCVTCYERRIREARPDLPYLDLLSVYYPQEFDAAGWRQVSARGAE
jgi:hypothetical protein